METEKIFWRGYGYEFKEKPADWFWALAILVGSVAALSIIYSNPLFAVFIIIAGITILLNARKSPRVIDFEMGPKGIYIDKILFPYGNIKSFWIEESKLAPPMLFIRAKRFITPVMVIPIETDYVEPDAVRDYLYQYVIEEKIHEPISHRLTRYLGL